MVITEAVLQRYRTMDAQSKLNEIQKIYRSGERDEHKMCAIIIVCEPDESDSALIRMGLQG